MSHLETATFATDNGAINVPTSGVFDQPVDPRTALEELKRRGWTPIEFPSEQAAINAAEKTSKAWGEAQGGEKKSMLQQALEPFIMGAQHSISAIRGDLANKGLVGTMWSGANQALAGAPHIYQPQIPTYALANPEAANTPAWLLQRLGIDPNAIKQVGSKSMGEIFGEQAGGPLVEALNKIIRASQGGRLPKTY